MWSHLIMLLAPLHNWHSRLQQGGEHLPVEELIPQLPAERLEVPILPGTPWFDEESFHSHLS